MMVMITKMMMMMMMMITMMVFITMMMLMTMITMKMKKGHSEEMEIAGWRSKEVPCVWFVATKKSAPSPKQPD